VERKNGPKPAIDGNWRNSLPTTLERRSSSGSCEKQESPHAVPDDSPMKVESPNKMLNDVFTFDVSQTRPGSGSPTMKFKEAQENNLSGISSSRRSSTASTHTEKSNQSGSGSPRAELCRISDLPETGWKASEENENGFRSDDRLDFDISVTRTSKIGVNSGYDTLSPSASPTLTARKDTPQVDSNLLGGMEQLSVSSPPSIGKTKFVAEERRKPKFRRDTRWNSPGNVIWKQELVNALQESQKKEITVPEDIATRFAISCT